MGYRYSAGVRLVELSFRDCLLRMTKDAIRKVDKQEIGKVLLIRSKNEEKARYFKETTTHFEKREKSANLIKGKKSCEPQ